MRRLCSATGIEACTALAAGLRMCACFVQERYPSVLGFTSIADNCFQVRTLVAHLAQANTHNQHSLQLLHPYMSLHASSTHQGWPPSR